MKSPAIHRTPLYRAKAAYANILRRCRGGTATEKTYQDVEVKMSPQEWLDWAVPKYEQFINENPELRPCVSRKGDQGHYELGNVEIVSTVENSAVLSSRRKKTIRKLVCPVCATEFSRLAHNVDYKVRQGKQPTCSRSCGGKVSSLGR